MVGWLDCGLFEGNVEGTLVGIAVVGDWLGNVGENVGRLVVGPVGVKVGDKDGFCVLGEADGRLLYGDAVGNTAIGDCVGPRVTGAADGTLVGAYVVAGRAVGLADGFEVKGDLVGDLVTGDLLGCEVDGD